MANVGSKCTSIIEKTETLLFFLRLATVLAIIASVR
jgi:hypothetical protein